MDTPRVTRYNRGEMRFTLVAALSALLLGAGAQEAKAPRRVVIVPIVGEINLVNRALVHRAVQRIKAEKPDLVVFEIDTPGGAVGDTLDMGEEMMSLAPIPTAAFVRPLAAGGNLGAAWSAGAYLAFSCKKIYMYPGSVIGAATPIMMTPEGVKPVEEKMLSALREKFRARAEQNGYPANLAVAMVDKDLEVFEVTIEGKKLYLTAGELDKLRAQGKEFAWPTVPFDSKDKLLTLTDRQVAETGMGKPADSRRPIYEEHGLASPQEQVIEASWSEHLAGFLTSGVVSTLLLIVGILGIWVEFKTPGFGIAGVVGILAIALLLFGHHLAGLAEVSEILLFVLGVGLVVAELVFFPGVGFLAIGGVVCIFAGLILSLQNFVLPDTTGAPWQVDQFLSSVGRVVFGFLGAGVGFAALLRFLPRVPVLNALVLQAQIGGTAPTPAAVEAGTLAGRQGHAVTPLRPGGKIEVGGEVYDVVAEGDFVAKGEPVEVLRVEGARVVVRKLKR